MRDHPIPIRDLATPNLVGKPTGAEILAQALQVPYCEGPGFAERVRGWLIPSLTGDYELAIINEGNSECGLVSLTRRRIGFNETRPVGMNYEPVVSPDALNSTTMAGSNPSHLA